MNGALYVRIERFKEKEERQEVYDDFRKFDRGSIDRPEQSP